MRGKYSIFIRGLIICLFLNGIAQLPPLCVFAQEQNSLKNKAVAEKNTTGNFVEITLAQGMVQIQSAGSAQWKNASIGTKLYPNDKIRTLIESLAQLKYPDNTTLTLRENSMLTIQDISRDPKSGLTKRELKLNLGGMKYKVTRLEEKGSEFKIHSSTAIVGVTGTEGTITNQGQGQPTKNILTEGSTYNTDENNSGGQPQKPGNAWEIEEGAKIDRHMLAESEKNEQEYKERDPAAEKRFNEFIVKYNQKLSQGYDIRPLEEILALLYQAAGVNDTVKINALLDEAGKLLENLAKSTDKDAQETNELLQELIKDAEAKEKDGFDLSKVYPLLSKAKKSFQEEKYEETKDTVEEARQVLSACEKKAYDFQSRFQQFLDELSLKGKSGFIVDEIVELTRRIKISFDNGERPQAEELLIRAKEMLSLAKRGIPEELLKSLEELKVEVASKKKEGFEVARLEELLLEAFKAKDENEYLKLEGLIKEAKERMAQGLNKKMAEELLVLFNKFEEELKKRGEGGYDLGGMQGLIHSIYEAKEKGDFGELAKLLAQAHETLAKIKVPEPLLKHLQDIKNKIEEKEKAGYQINELEALLAQIQSAFDKGAIKEAQNLFAKVEELLNALTDGEPPLLQAGDPLYQTNTVVISGVATDNIKVAWVNVNGNQADLDATGKFTKELPLIAGLAEIKVEAADAEGNLAPQIIIPVPADKVPPPEDEDKTPPELKLEDIGLNYIMPDQLKIEGKTGPAAIISINKADVYADASGAFSSQLAADKELVDSGLILSARDAKGNVSEALNIKVEDKWPAQIKISAVELYDNLPPALKTNDLVYEKDMVKVSGSCIDAANIVVQGVAEDIGGAIKNISINQGAALLEGDTFKSALPLTADLKSVEIIAEDSSGNKTSLSRSVDFFLKIPAVFVNDRQVTLDKEGAFTVLIPLDADLHQVVINAKDNLGNQTSPVKLVVADRVPPALSLGDVLYTMNSIEINGRTEAHATVSDKSAKLFNDKITADDSGIFKITAKRPAENITAILIAEDISGNLSEEIPLAINAPVDQKPPLLTVANLDYQNDKIIVSGSAEDDTGIKSVTVNNKEMLLNNNQFSEEVLASADLLKIEVIATDLSGKTTAVVKAVGDTVKPQVNLKELKYEGGYCIVQANASDNLGLKEVRVNNVPVPVKLPEGGDFEYKLAVTADLKEVIIGALDLYGNYTQTPAAAIALPPDSTAPVLTLDEITYGSPIAIVSGKVTDNLGVKNVLINNLPVNIYEDGSFKTRVPINFGAPSLSLNEPAYDNGLVIISGRLNSGAQEPYEIIAQAEDLSGNKSELLKKPITPFNKGDLRVIIDGNPVDIENDAFSVRLPLEKGASDIEAEVVDPFGNTSGVVTLALEKIPPALNVDDPVYKENAVTISGTATDSGSGISEVLVNDQSVNLGSDGKFSRALTLNENNVIVVAVDKLGNMSTAPPVQLAPPDKGAPLFMLKITPMPATVGKNIFIGIEALDSKTRMPELLPKPPEVKVILPGGETKNLTLSGAGASFNGTLETSGLSTGLISISVKGTDQSGNTGDKTEGASSFLLNSTDNIAPALKINVFPPPPAVLGTNLKIVITASETLKSLPKAEINLPGATNFPLKLEGPLSGTLFTASVVIPANLAPGNAVIRIGEIIDLAGNIQGTPAETSFLIMPQAVKSNLPLYIEGAQISPDKISIKGNTAAEAIVHLNIADIKADLAADINGRFNFTREITRADIEKWTKNFGPFLRLDGHAINYAGISSEKITLNLPLPLLTPDSAAKDAAFLIEITPQPLEQGKEANILVRSRNPLSQPPRSIIKLSDGRVEPLVLSGSGKEFSGIYRSSPVSRPGSAIIEIKADSAFQAKPFLIVPPFASGGAGFFMLSVTPDPIIVGKEAEINIIAQRPLDTLPRLNIRLPNGKSESIMLAGEGKEFKGKYLCPADMPPGPAELIVNDGEFRRPCGIAPGFAFGAITARDIFGFSNPMPMLAGAGAAITVKSMKNLDYLPKVDLRLGNGRFIPITLSGNVPGSIFNGQVNIPADAPYGPAFILVRSNKGEFLGEYPTGIAPSMSAMSGAEFEAFMVPYSAMPGQNVMINVKSKRGPVSFLPQVKLNFSNNTILPVRLEGALPNQNFLTSTNIPATASFGPVAIIVSDNSGRPSGAGQSMIGAGTQMTGGDIQINLMPPNIVPGSPFELSIFAPNSLYQLPKAALNIPGKSPIDLRLNGQVPGNAFRAAATFPREAKVSESKIEVRFDRGQGEETRTIYLEGGNETGPEFRPPKLTPYPPIPGQPLMLNLYAPEQVDFIPLVRVNYINGQSVPLNMSGPIPGDTFTGTLPNVATYIKSLDVIDPEDNSVIITLPIEMFGGATGTPQTPRVEFNPPAPLMPSMMTNLTLDFPGPVPVVPRVNLQLPDGRNINVFVNGMIPGTHFTGVFNIPSDAPYGQANLQVYVAEQLVPGIPTVMIGAGVFTNSDPLDLRVFPGNCQELILDWYILPNAAKHRVTYEAAGIPPKSIEVSRIGHYVLTGLTTNTEYKVTLVALDSRSVEISRAERIVRVPECGGALGNGFPLRANLSGTKDVQLNWDPQYGAASYELRRAIDADPMGGTALPLGNVTSYLVSSLNDGKHHFIVEAINSTGERARSQEAIVFIGMADPGEPTLTPNPPVIGHPLEIQFNTPEMISVIPKVGVHYQTMAEDPATVTGAIPGSAFVAHIPNVKDVVTAINFYDPYTNALRHTSPVSQAPTTGGPTIGDPWPNNPPVPNTETNFPVFFPTIPTYTPVITALFSNGALKTLQVSGSAQNYTGKLIATEWPTVAVTGMIIEVKDTAGAVKVSRPFPVGTVSSGTNTLTVNPDPPVIGQNVYVTLQTANPQASQPYVKFLFTDGTYWNVLMFGNAGGTNFNFTYTTLYKSLNAIEIWDNGQANKLAEKILGSSSSANNYFIKVYTSGPTQEYPFTPTTPNPLASCWQLATSPDNPGMAAFSVTATNTCAGTNNNIAVPALAYTITKIELWDNTKSILLATKDFNQPSANCWQLNVSPDPPQLAVACNVTLTNTCGIPLTLTPAHLRIYFEGNITKDYTMSGSGTSFSYALTAADMNRFVNKIQAFNDNWELIIEKVFSSGTMGYPTNLWDEATGISTERRIHWDTVAWAPGYDIYLGLSNPPSTIWKDVVDGNINTEFVSGLTVGQTYWYYVTVDGYTQHAPPESFTAGEGVASSGLLELVTPASGDIYFGNVSSGQTTSTQTITIKNKDALNPAKIRKKSQTGKIHNQYFAFNENDIILSGADIPANSQGDFNLSVSVPLGAATYPGSFATVDDTDDLVLFDDKNGSGQWEAGEAILNKAIFIALTVSGVAGIDVLQGNVMPPAVYPGTTTASQTFNIDNTAGVDLIDIKYDRPTLYEENNYALTIASSNINVTLNLGQYSGYYVLGGPETSDSAVTVTVPLGTAAGTYRGDLRIYQDADHDGQFDSTTEPSDTLHLEITVNASPISNLTATNAGVSGTVNLSWNGPGAGYHYHIYYSTTSGGQTFSSPIDSANTSKQITSLTNGVTYYFVVRSAAGATHTAGDLDADSNTTQASAMPTNPGSVDHITLSTVPTGTSTSAVGKPVLIKATAYSSSNENDSTVATAFSNSVTVSASSSGNMHILSLQNRVSGSIAGLQLSSGIGYFTVDAVQAENVNLSISGYTSNSLNITFSTPVPSDLSASQIALTYEQDSAVNVPAKITVFVVNNYGKTAANWTGTININITNDPGGQSTNLTTFGGEATNPLTGGWPSYNYTFHANDYGRASFNLNDSSGPETVSFNVNGASLASPGQKQIAFAGLEKFIIEPNNPVIRGTSIQLTAFAATANGKKINGYNSSPGPDPAVTFVPDSEIGGSSSNSSSAAPNPLSFSNGVATFTLSDTEYEQVIFHISNGPKSSDQVTAWFKSSSDTTDPDVTSAVAETPFLIHLYFTEDIDSVNALRKDNYTGVGNINKVCWYGDEVTLHLAAPLALGSGQSVTVEASVPNGIRDQNGNYLNGGVDKVANFSVPNVNYQGSSYGSGDWLEINVSPSTVSYTGNQTVRVIIRHKNACGYLTGSNAVNRGTDVTNVNLSYTGNFSVNPSSASMSDGKCELDVTPYFTSPGQTVTITASANGVTSGTVTITSQ